MQGNVTETFTPAEVLEILEERFKWAMSAARKEGLGFCDSAPFVIELMQQHERAVQWRK